MKNGTTVIGMDVHKETVVVAVLGPDEAQAQEVLTIANTLEAITRLVNRLGRRGALAFVYEAGPCGYEIQRQITALGYRCAVIAPSLIPVKAGDRVKTDRRDAQKLAKFYRSGELTEVRIPMEAEESARDLVRAREDALEDRLRARHRLQKFLLRQGRIYRQTKGWGVQHRQWLLVQRFNHSAMQQTFEAYLRSVEETENRLAVLNQQVEDLAEQEAYRTPVRYLKCLKGIDILTAMTLVVEIQDFRRFAKASALMGFTGLTPSEHSSGPKAWRGSITKSGNAHVRRVLVESAWCSRNADIVSRALAERRRGCPSDVVKIARKAQTRLHRTFWRLTHRGKAQPIAAVAVARELAGFVWAIGQHFPQATTA
jgi:transposase